MQTPGMAEEISRINAGLSEAKETCFLIGPGRWGSSIPTLGVPVLWTDISSARMVVEYGLEDFRVDPSQGTHFVQNITSLGVGYLTVDQFAGTGTVDFEAISRLECVHSGRWAKVYKVPGLTGYIDRDRGMATIGF